MDKIEKIDKGLEEAAKEYEWSNVDTNQLNPPTLDMTVQVGDLRNAFIAGAEWQKEQDMDEWIKDRDGCFWDGVNEGKKAMREQMLKDAVEGKIYGYGDGSFELVASWLDMPENPIYKDGDKVRIIIMKEEEQI